MKKILVYFLTIGALASISSCSTVKNGIGKGYSTNEQVSIDKAKLYAMTDASMQNRVSVTQTTEATTTDTDGIAVTSYTDTRTSFTETTFTDGTFKNKTNKKGRHFITKSKFNGKIINNEE